MRSPVLLNDIIYCAIIKKKESRANLGCLRDSCIIIIVTYRNNSFGTYMNSKQQ